MKGERTDHATETEGELLEWLVQFGVIGEWIPQQYDPTDDLDGEDFRVFGIPGGNSPKWSIELSFAPKRRIGLGIKFEGFGDIYLWAFWPISIPLSVLQKILEAVLSGRSSVVYNKLWDSGPAARYLELPDETITFIKSNYSKQKILNVRSRRRRMFLTTRIPLQSQIIVAPTGTRSQ